MNHTPIIVWRELGLKEQTLYSSRPPIKKSRKPSNLNDLCSRMADITGFLVTRPVKMKNLADESTTSKPDAYAEGGKPTTQEDSKGVACLK